MPMDEWITKGQSGTNVKVEQTGNAYLPSNVPVVLTEAKPSRFIMETFEPLSKKDDSTESKENSAEKPALKRFKFTPISSNSSDDSNKTSPKNNEKKIVEKRQGFVGPPKNAVFYGEEFDSDDDFQ